MAGRIEDYGLIGDTHTAALVSSDGSLDWLCLPRFDSGACFAALLGNAEHGRWRIAPAADSYTVHREYIDDSLVLRTVFETPDGSVELFDFMPIRSDELEVDVARIVRCTRGHVPMTMEATFRFDYGKVVPWVRRTDFGLRAVAGPNALDFHSPVELRNENFQTRASFELRGGESASFYMVWYPSHRHAPQARTPEQMLPATLDWWERWVSQCSTGGTTRHIVKRSAMVLKALTYAPTGGIVAAPTTSLPELPGSVRNWDYRYCWIRDATFTLYALLISGFVEEAGRWRDWLMRAVAGRPQQMQIMFGLAGERLLPEYELNWLPGYEGSAPVRVGNAAHKQFQLDVYGEIMDVFHVGRRAGMPNDENAWAFQRELLNVLDEVWRLPDEGLWEVRGPRRHFTHSKVMAWVALDRAVRAVEQSGLDGPVDRWRALREQVHKDVCAHGYNAEKGAFVQYYGGEELDSALLMVPLVGFLPATDERVVGTVNAIQRNLAQDGFVRRYVTHPEVDGLPQGEGYFLPCTLWLADVLNMQGHRDQAQVLFDKVRGAANDLGLLSEEYDPVEKRLLGNFPQALTHLGLVNTAHNLALPSGPANDRAAGGDAAENESEPRL